MTKKFHQHYVYIATYDDVVIYIGKGSKHRYKHVTSGASSICRLNELYFTGDRNKLNVEIIKGFYTDEEAREYETMLIEKFRPECNSWSDYGVVVDSKLALNVKEIEQYREDYVSRVDVKDKLLQRERLELGMSISYSGIAKEYVELNKEMLFAQPQHKQQLLDDMSSILSLSPELETHIETVGIARIEAEGYSINRVRKLYEQKIMIHDFLPLLQNKIELDKTYTSDELKRIIELSSKDLNITPKISIVKKAFNVNTTTVKTDGKHIGAYKIISKKDLLHE